MTVRRTGLSGPVTTPVLALDSLVRLGRARRTPTVSRRLALPAGMTSPLGCDAVAVPAHHGPLLLSRLPRAGCVYADRGEWWWIVPRGSDVVLDWPAPAHYAPGAFVPESLDAPELIHRPAGTAPYTPPIPLYVALCHLTGTAPAWSRPLSA
ncbi:hypothetical protein AB0C59_25395 [Streptomyces sp. NPDC048664]|uniref:hypothetical protein n=1 Tax=Streptomyces sp. NPDC048664 TaxID=3154505 RepID=UPI0034414CD9